MNNGKKILLALFAATTVIVAIIAYGFYQLKSQTSLMPIPKERVGE